MVRLEMPLFDVMPLFNVRLENATVHGQVGNPTLQCQVGNATGQVGNATVQVGNATVVRLEMPLFNIR